LDKKEYNEKRKPKRPKNAYLLFALEKRSEFPTLPITEQSKQLGDLWRKLPTEAREAYEKKQRDEQAEYQKRLSAWNKTWGVPM